MVPVKVGGPGTAAVKTTVGTDAPAPDVSAPTATAPPGRWRASKGAEEPIDVPAPGG